MKSQEEKKIARQILTAIRIRDWRKAGTTTNPAEHPRAHLQDNLTIDLVTGVLYSRAGADLGAVTPPTTAREVQDIADALAALPPLRGTLTAKRAALRALPMYRARGRGPQPQNLETLSITLPNNLIKKARRLGHGNASAGIRQALTDKPEK